MRNVLLSEKPTHWEKVLASKLDSRLDIMMLTPEAKNMLKGMLCHDPTVRMSVDECLMHPWIRQADVKDSRSVHFLYDKNRTPVRRLFQQRAQQSQQKRMQLHGSIRAAIFEVLTRKISRAEATDKYGVARATMKRYESAVQKEMGFVGNLKSFKQTVLEAREDSAFSPTKLQNAINNHVFESAGRKCLLKQEEVDEEEENNSSLPTVVSTSSRLVPTQELVSTKLYIPDVGIVEYHVVLDRRVMLCLEASTKEIAKEQANQRI
eukprot:gene10624-11774_t